MECVGLGGGVGIHAFPHIGVFVVYVRLKQR
jgi:hypothetical protein